MKKNSPVIPETVTDQIRLWEAERNRAVYHKGVLYESFPSLEVFNRVVQYAKDIGVYVWSLQREDRQLLMVADGGHDAVRTFIKKETT